MRKFLVLLILFFLSSQSAGQSLGGLVEDLGLELTLPGGIVPGNMEMTIYIVYGSDLDLVERMVFDSLTSNYSSTQTKATIRSDGMEMTEEVEVEKIIIADNQTSLEDLGRGTSVVVLVGGPTHNVLTEKAYSAGLVTNESTKYFGQLTIGKGVIDEDTGLMVLYHNISEGRLEREAVEHSPLKGVIADGYIPMAATSIGMVLMSLFTVAKTVAEFLALDLGRKKRVFGHTGPHIKGIYFNEVAAILGAAMVLGFAVTWTYAGPTPAFFDLILLNSGICLFAALSHELSHRLVGRLFGVQVEYRFWLGGSLITILTAFLGNSFGIQGFLMEKIEGDISKWKYAVTKLAAPVVSASITAIFAFLYLQDPGIVYQMIYATASIWAMAEILPVRGLDGFEVRSWNRLIWFFFFLVISGIYFTVNFIQ